jgi:hypothetical protein
MGMENRPAGGRSSETLFVFFLFCSLFNEAFLVTQIL